MMKDFAYKCNDFIQNEEEHAEKCTIRRKHNIKIA